MRLTKRTLLGASLSVLAAPLTAPILGLPPKFEPPKNPFPLMVKLGAYHATMVDGK